MARRPPEAAERSLRVTVSLLRRALEPDLERGSDSRYVLQRQPGYLFDRGAGCKVDAWEFERHQRKAKATQEQERLEEAIEEGPKRGADPRACPHGGVTRRPVFGGTGA